MTTRPQAGVLRRLAAMFYDGLLVIAIWLVASALPLLFTHGEAIGAGNPLMTLYLLALTFVFFGGFWTHGGQTVGMRAWRLRLERNDGQALTWSTALARFLTALPAWTLLIFGVLHASVPVSLPLPQFIIAAPEGLWLVLACVWLILDSRPQCWRERLTATRVVILSKQEQRSDSANPPQ